MAGRHGGRVAFITGAGGGIGRATALRLADEGASIAAVDLRAEAAKETASLVEQRGGTAVGLAADVRDRAAVNDALQHAAETLGGIDLLVNNAGLVTMESFEELTDESWDLVMDVNLKGAYIVTQLATPFLKRAADGAAIVNFSSIEADIVVSSRGTCQVHYNAAKAGVKLLTKAVAVELARYGIRVNCVAPGPIATGFIPGGNPHAPEVMDFLGQRLLINRLGEPSDVAAAVSFLLSSDASWITGTQLVIDGGWTTR